MRDQTGRDIDYIRISITDRCNLRCVYCMPQEGMHSLSQEEILSYDEIVYVCTLMAQMGTSGAPRQRCSDRQAETDSGD